MHRPTAHELFDAFAAAWLRGDRPDPATYLDRAEPHDADRAELALLIDAFVQAAPLFEPTDDEVAVMHARLAGEPGLIALRIQQRRKVDHVVNALVERLRVTDVARTKSYYQRLEGGTLDPAPVSRRVWDALDAIFGTPVRALVRPIATPAGGSAMAYYRWRGGPAPTVEARYAHRSPVTQSPAAEREQELERDELDRLFLGG